MNYDANSHEKLYVDMGWACTTPLCLAWPIVSLEQILNVVGGSSTRRLFGRE